MLGRLIVGIVKGLVIGALLGFALAKLGLAAPGAFVAYVAAAIGGVLTGLIAGKPIWAKDAKVEAGMKAGVGALLAAGLMFAARRWLTMPLPFSLGELGGANASLGEAAGSTGTIGGLAITSLAAVSAALGGFYEADNTPTDEAPAGKEGAAEAAKRIATPDAEEDVDNDDAEADPKRAKR